jgi:DnaJ-class molecular chaperone
MPESPAKKFSEPIIWKGMVQTCPDCRGTGSIVLLTSRVRCERCGGNGFYLVLPSTVSRECTADVEPTPQAES